VAGELTRDLVQVEQASMQRHVGGAHSLDETVASQEISQGA
jgi:hypothetical protein